jgi:tRNA(Ile)-lysidine synthase
MPTTAVLRCLLDDLIFADASQSPYLLWSGVAVRRYRDMLHISKHTLHELTMPQPFYWSNFPQPHRINDTQQWVAKPSQSGLHVPLGAQLEVRYRVGGESIVWRGHRRSLKKLWQAAGVAPWLRDKMPFIYLNGQLAAVLDFCVSDVYYRDHGERVYTLSKIGVHDDNNSMG